MSAACRFAGFVILDECPVQATELLADSVFVRPIGHLSPESYFDVVTRMLSNRSWRPPDADEMFARTHPCAALRFEVVQGESAHEALRHLHGASLPYVLSLAHRLMTPCRVLCAAVEDLELKSILFDMQVGSAVPYFFYPEGGREFLQGVQALEDESGHALLLLRAFSDLLSDDNPEYRIVKGWMALELMADALGVRTPRKATSAERTPATVRRVAALVQRLETEVDNGLVFTKGTWEDAKLGFLSAVYQRRNCIIHAGRCSPGAKRCQRRQTVDQRCGDLEPLSKDLVLLAHSMLRSYVHPSSGIQTLSTGPVSFELRGGRIVPTQDDSDDAGEG
jgi:hypothetical protein